MSQGKNSFTAIFTPNLGQVLLKNDFFDVTLVVEGKEIQTHREILSSASPVFKAMFKHNTSENEKRAVVIEDLTFDAVEKMVQLIYLGVVDSSYSSFDVLQAADKYEVKGLVTVCENLLLPEFTSELTAESVAMLLIQADHLNANILKEAALDFVVKHLKQVTETEEWKEGMNNRADLVLQVSDKVTSLEASPDAPAPLEGSRDESPPDPVLQLLNSLRAFST